MIILCSAVDANRDVLSKLVPVVENYDEVDVELNLEEWVTKCWTGVDLGEQHVEWDFKTRYYVAVCNLNVLNLSRVGLSFKSFYSHQLNLD